MEKKEEGTDCSPDHKDMSAKVYIAHNDQSVRLLGHPPPPFLTRPSLYGERVLRPTTKAYGCSFL